MNRWILAGLLAVAACATNDEYPLSERFDEPTKVFDPAVPQVDEDWPIGSVVVDDPDIDTGDTGDADA